MNVEILGGVDREEDWIGARDAPASLSNFTRRGMTQLGAADTRDHHLTPKTSAANPLLIPG